MCVSFCFVVRSGRLGSHLASSPSIMAARSASSGLSMVAECEVKRRIRNAAEDSADILKDETEEQVSKLISTIKESFRTMGDKIEGEIASTRTGSRI